MIYVFFFFQKSSASVCFSLIKLISDVRTNGPFLCPSCQARKLVVVRATRCVFVAKGTLCPMTAINALCAAAAKQPRWPQLHVSITELAWMFSLSPVTFPSLHFLHLIWLAHPLSGSSLRGVGRQPVFFFSFKCYVLRDLDRLLFSLTPDEGGMAAGKENCSSHWDGFKNVLRTNTSMFTNAGISPKHCLGKNWCHVLNMF